MAANSDCIYSNNILTDAQWMSVEHTALTGKGIFNCCKRIFEHYLLALQHQHPKKIQEQLKYDFGERDVHHTIVQIKAMLSAEKENDMKEEVKLYRQAANTCGIDSVWTQNCWWRGK